MSLVPPELEEAPPRAKATVKKLLADSDGGISLILSAGLGTPALLFAFSFMARPPFSWIAIAFAVVLVVVVGRLAPATLRTARRRRVVLRDGRLLRGTVKRREDRVESAIPVLSLEVEFDDVDGTHAGIVFVATLHPVPDLVVGATVAVLRVPGLRHSFSLYVPPAGVFSGLTIPTRVLEAARLQSKP